MDTQTPIQRQTATERDEQQTSRAWFVSVATCRDAELCLAAAASRGGPRVNGARLRDPKVPAPGTSGRSLLCYVRVLLPLKGARTDRVVWSFQM